MRTHARVHNISSRSVCNWWYCAGAGVAAVTIDSLSASSSSKSLSWSSAVVFAWCEWARGGEYVNVAASNAAGQRDAAFELRDRSDDHLTRTPKRHHTYAQQTRRHEHRPRVPCGVLAHVFIQTTDQSAERQQHYRWSLIRFEKNRDSFIRRSKSRPRFERTCTRYLWYFASWRMCWIVKRLWGSNCIRKPSIICKMMERNSIAPSHSCQDSKCSSPSWIFAINATNNPNEIKTMLVIWIVVCSFKKKVLPKRSTF